MFPGMESLQEVDVACVAQICKIRFTTIGLIEVALHLDVIALAERSGPASQDIAAGEHHVSVTTWENGGA